MHIVQALYQQEADYRMVLPAVASESERFAFTSSYMEDVNGEEDGMLQASIFPFLAKNAGVNSGLKVCQQVAAFTFDADISKLRKQLSSRQRSWCSLDQRSENPLSLADRSHRSAHLSLCLFTACNAM